MLPSIQSILLPTYLGTHIVIMRFYELLKMVSQAELRQRHSAQTNRLLVVRSVHFFTGGRFHDRRKGSLLSRILSMARTMPTPLWAVEQKITAGILGLFKGFGMLFQRAKTDFWQQHRKSVLSICRYKCIACNFARFSVFADHGQIFFITVDGSIYSQCENGELNIV